MNCEFCNNIINSKFIVSNLYDKHKLCYKDNCQEKLSHKHNICLYCLNERIRFIENFKNKSNQYFKQSKDWNRFPKSN